MSSYKNVAHFAEKYDLSKRYIYRKISSGEIRSFNVGSDAKPNYRISEESMIEFVTARSNQAPVSTAINAVESADAPRMVVVPV